jgi:hypothetical protein
MAILTMYVDESYSHPPQPLIYTIAGYVSEDWRWKRFETEWDKALKAYGFDDDIPFHMKDFAHKKGIYKDWPEKKRVKFIRTLQHIIKTNTLKDFAVSVVVADYDKLIPPKTNIRYGFGEPHVFAIIGCMKNIGTWQKEMHMNDPMLYTFEKGIAHDSMVARVFAEMDEPQREYYRVGGIAFFGKKVLPLQSADMLAYENMLDMRRQSDPTNTRGRRESLKNLYRPNISDWSFYNEERITIVLDTAEKMGLVQRVVTEEK